MQGAIMPVAKFWSPRWEALDSAWDSAGQGALMPKNMPSAVTLPSHSMQAIAHAATSESVICKVTTSNCWDNIFVNKSGRLNTPFIVPPAGGSWYGGMLEVLVQTETGTNTNQRYKHTRRSQKPIQSPNKRLAASESGRTSTCREGGGGCGCTGLVTELRRAQRRCRWNLW